MNKLNSKNLYTSRLELRLPTMKEQYRLWEILIDENVNRYYFPTPDRIFIKNNLNKENINDLKNKKKTIYWTIIWLGKTKNFLWEKNRKYSITRG